MLTSTSMEQDGQLPIAIVGMACRLPGGANSPSKLWDMIVEKRPGRSEIHQSRMNVDAFYHPNPDRRGTFNMRAGHFLEHDISAFDASFFSISPAEASSLDPQQRLLLETAYEAAESAGMPLERLAGSNTSCYVGCFTHDYSNMLAHDSETSPLYKATGNGSAILANRVSYFFDLKGPSLAVDTGCSSSLVALHLACQSIRSGESSGAIVGGTNLLFDPDVMIAMSNMHFLGSDGKCFTYDHRANGYSRGEGIVAVYIKPLADAIRDHDTIRAVIRGTASNQDGRTAGLTLPSRVAQEALIRSAYATAECDPSTTGYFEAHGTGTPAGDPIEAGAIGSSLGVYREPGDYLYVGSVKTNIGHTEGASGLAGLIKTVLALEAGLIPPNINFERGNSDIDFDTWRIRVPTEVTPWPRAGIRRASINSFGFGGSNAHVILDDALHYLQERGLDAAHCTAAKPSVGRGAPIITVATAPPSDDVDSGHASMDGSNASEVASDGGFTSGREEHLQHRIFTWSTHDESSMKEMMLTYLSALSSLKPAGAKEEQQLLTDLAYTLCERRSQNTLKYKTVIVANSLDSLTSKLEAEGHQKPTQSSIRVKPPRTAFVFTGQGAQWPGMANELLSTFPVFARSMVAAQNCLHEIGCAWSLVEELCRDQNSSRLNEAEISQPTCTAIQLGLVDLMENWGVLPAAVFGHSSGEIAAAYAAGKLSFNSAMQVAYHRGIVSAQVSKERAGAMLAAGISEEEGIARVAKLKTKLGSAEVACINSPTSITLSGDIAAINKLEEELKAEGVFVRKLKVDTAYHSHHMRSVAGRYLELLQGLELSQPGEERCPDMISTVRCISTTGVDLDAQYWVDNLVSPVRFSEALEILLSGPGAKTVSDNPTKTIRSAGAIDLILEVGLHSALAGPIRQVQQAIASDKDIHNVQIIAYHSLLSRDKDSCATTLEAVAALWAHGVPVDLSKANAPSTSTQGQVPRMLVNLPSYPWNHKHKYWSESRLSTGYRLRSAARNDFLGAPVADWNPVEPRWRHFIRLSEQPWVRDHAVQDTVIYPAAGYIAMALEAAQQMVPLAERCRIEGYTITDIVIDRALVVPESEAGIEVVFQGRPMSTGSKCSSDSWMEFRVMSYDSEKVDAPPSEHCRGCVRVEYKVDTGEVDAGREAREALVCCDAEFAAARKICHVKSTPDKVYKALDKIGLNYGPIFRNVAEVICGPGTSLVYLSVPDTKGIMPYQFEHDHILHPATIDTFLQALFPALAEDLTTVKEPYMPTFIEMIAVSARCKDQAKPGHLLEALSRASFVGFREVEASIVVRESEGERPLLTIEGVRGTALAASASSDNRTAARDGVKKLCFDVEWEPDLDFLYRPQLEAVLATGSKVEDLSPEHIATLEMIASYFYHGASTAMGDEDVPQPHHKKFLQFMHHHRLDVFAGRKDHQTQEWLDLDSPGGHERMEKLIRKIEFVDHECQMLIRIGRNLVPILRGEVDPLALMLEGNLLYDYYANSIGVASAYAQLRRYIQLFSFKNPSATYLEIGAGTGGATTHVLNALGGNNESCPRFHKYTYTDISSGFFEKAMKKFEEWSGLIDYRRLNIEIDPVEQGFEAEKFDVVVAFNVLHATKRMDATMANVRKLLKPGGKLIVLEITHVLDRVFLPFGTLPGWWLSEDEYRPLGPTMDVATWEALLERNGFGRLQACIADLDDPRDQLGSVMIAEVVDAAASPESDQALSVVDKMPPVIIATSEKPGEMENGLAEALFDRLSASGFRVTKTIFSSTRNVSDAVFDGKLVVCLADLSVSLLSDVDAPAFETLHAILQHAKGLLWLTRGAFGKVTRPEAALMHGLARTLRAENEGWPLITLDFSPRSAQAPSQQRVDTLLRLIQSMAKGVTTITDNEFSEREGFVHIKRCIEATDLNAQIAGRSHNNGEVQMEPFLQPDRPLTLAIDQPGLLDTLRFVDSPTANAPIPAGYVRISTHAAGVNFRDVMVCMGQVMSTSLGGECAGIVVAIGSGDVGGLTVGDRVCCAVLDAYSSVVTAPAETVRKIPEGMPFEVAASLPMVYCTAIYCLVHQARIQKGETVLIHAAAGGVGQAAIMLCQHYGAEVLVTVGTKEKKDHIMATYGVPEERMFSSRNATFADGVRRVTGGKGVDVILNCLSGELLRASWECIAPFGRFIEMGKKDILDNTRIDMAPFIRNVAFASVDMTIIFLERKKLVGQLLGECIDLLRQGVIRPVEPIKTFSYGKIEDAFRYMQAGKHIGKIVVVPGSEDMVPVVSRSFDSGPSLFRPGASYIVAGGFGGLGRSLIGHMVARGAKHLIILSRSGPSTPSSAKLVSDLELNHGIKVFAPACDITCLPSVTATLGDAITKHGFPPIRGVIQAAMVLSDRVFANMPHETFTSVLRPKTHGSWNLHQATLNAPLDFFVMLASAAGIVGDTSQGNYAAANAYQDALAYYRAQNNLPAAVVDLGMVGAVGYVSENQPAAQNLHRWGFLEIDEREFLAIVDGAVGGTQRTQVVTGITTRVESEEDQPHWFRDPVFSHLGNMRARASEGSGTGEGPGLGQKLAEAGSMEVAAGLVLGALVGKLSRSLLMPETEIDVARPTAAYGVDSLVAVEVRNWLAREARADVPVFDILQATSLQALGNKIAEKSTLVKI